MNIDQWYNCYLQKTHQYTGWALGPALLTAINVSRPRAESFDILSCFWSCVKELLHFRDFHTGCGMHYAHRWLHCAAERATEDGAVMHLCIYCTQQSVRSYVTATHVQDGVSLWSRHRRDGVMCYTVEEKHHFFIFTTAGCMPGVYGPCGFTVCSSKFELISISNKGFQSLVQLEQSPPWKRLRQAERWTTWCSNRQREFASVALTDP